MEFKTANIPKEIMAAEAMAEKRAKEDINEQDYIGEDGLLYCGDCNTPRQCRVILFGEERKPYCLCKCRAERRDEEYRRIKLAERVAELRKNGFPEQKMLGWTFANDDGTNNKIIAAMKNYTDNFEKMRENGKGLLLFGTVGTGKTYAAACVANALIDRGIPAHMTNFARIANTVQGMFDGRQEYYDSFNRFPLLIIDDLSAERKTEYMQEIVFNVIDSRYRSGLPLIVTTNLTGEELKHPADITNQRTFSRLLEMCIPLEVSGADRRRERLKEDFKEYKDILGI